MKHHRTAISLFSKAECKGFTPSLFTLNILINCYCHLGNMFLLSILGKILKMGCQPDIITLTTLLKGQCINTNVREALVFHNDILTKGFQLDEVSYGTLIDGFCKIGKTSAALELLRKMETGLVKPGCITKAEAIVGRMMKSSIKPDVISYSALMDGYCMMNNVDESKKVLNRMKSDVLPDVSVTVS
ncbi:pentatricopeptide repeat-containing protein At1g64583, mitochondrial-like [Neltuma alba]|uniref:pentatricopeptide repeat-containing protein At1g64583, mitochondrial-like n=1 Tax=Neltuma alba TaxID=207710 RepID=UPI0010A35172|nr:pentatricopeptide repeat-containing protein At1g64583, mitochondrial-like [Prosopis alba]